MKDSLQKIYQGILFDKFAITNISNRAVRLECSISDCECYNCQIEWKNKSNLFRMVFNCYKYNDYVPDSFFTITFLLNNSIKNISKNNKKKISRLFGCKGKEDEIAQKYNNLRQMIYSLYGV